MILQFKTIYNNSTYEEADSISYKYITLKDMIDDYKKCRYMSKNNMVDAIIDYIKKQSWSSNIIFNIGALDFMDMNQIVIVTLESKDKRYTRVFDASYRDKNTSVYILNSNGKTIHKLVEAK